MILSQKQIEEIAAAVTEDFNKFFFGTESEEVRMARKRLSRLASVFCPTFL